MASKRNIPQYKHFQWYLNGLNIFFYTKINVLKLFWKHGNTLFGLKKRPTNTFSIKRKLFQQELKPDQKNGFWNENLWKQSCNQKVNFEKKSILKFVKSHVICSLNIKTKVTNEKRGIFKIFETEIKNFSAKKMKMKMKPRPGLLKGCKRYSC